MREMEPGGEVKEVKVDFDQLVRIFVDTDVDTHFIVSLGRSSTVAELRELVKVTHRHCYPDSGDVDIGKLAVPGGDYGYHLADFLLIGQVYDRYEGKVFAEVKNHDPAASSSQGVFRNSALSIKPSSTQKRVSLGLQPVDNVAGFISTNASEPGALLPVGSSPCEARVELIVPKLQKEEIDEDGNYILGSQEPLDGHPSRARGLAVGVFGRIDEEEDEKLVEIPCTAVNDGEAKVSGVDVVLKADHLNPDMCSADLHVKPDKISLGASQAVSSDIQEVGRKRNASGSNERPFKFRRLVLQDPSGNSSKAPPENGQYEYSSGAIERPKDGRSNLDGMNDAVKDVNAAASLAHQNRSSDIDSGYLSSSGSKRKKKKALLINDLAINQNGSEAAKDATMLGVEDKEEMYNDEIWEKERHGGSDLVTGSGVGGIVNNGPEVGREGEAFSLLEDGGVPPALDRKGKTKRNLKQVKKQKQEKEPEGEKEEETEKKKKPSQQGKRLQQQKTEKKINEQKQKQKEPEEEKQPGQEEHRELEKQVGQEKTENDLKTQKQKKTALGKQPEQEVLRELEKQTELETMENSLKKQKQKKPAQGKQPKQEENRGLENQAEQEKTENKSKMQNQKKPVQEKTDKGEKKGKKEKEQKQEKTKTKDEKEKKEKGKKGKKQIVDEITPLDTASLPVLEESDKKPQQHNAHLEATAVNPNLSQHVDNDEEDSGDDVPDVKINKGRIAAAALACDFRSRMGDEGSGRTSASNFVNDEISESGTPQREAQPSRDISEGTNWNGAMTSGLGNINDKVLPSATKLFGDVNDVEASPSFQGGTEASPESQGTRVGSVESQETPNPSKHLSYTRAGRGVPSQTRSIESSRDLTMGKQIGGRDTKINETQNSQCSDKATQQSEGINLASEVSGAWLRRGMLESEPGHIDQSLVAAPGAVAHTRSSTSESSAESDPRSADQTEVRSHQDLSREEDQIPEALHANHTSRTVENLGNHAGTSVKRADGGQVNIKNYSLEVYSQDQSFHVAPTQVEKALSGSTTEDSDESDTDPDAGTDTLMNQTAGNVHVTDNGGGGSQGLSDERGDLATPARRSFPSLTARTPVPSVSRMTNNGSSQSFKRRASGVAAEIEAKFAQFIESQGGLDEIMGITLGQRKRSMPVESSTQGGSVARSTGSLATPFGSPLDLALNTQESVKDSPIALDIAQASQNPAGKYFTPQFKVPKPVSTVTTPGGVQGAFNSAATTLPLAGRKSPKARVTKELRLKRKESSPRVDKTKELNILLEKHKIPSLLPALESSKETFLADRDAAEGKLKSAGNSSLVAPQETPKVSFLDGLNAAGKRKSSVEKNSEKKKRLAEKHLGSQFMIVNNTDHILELEYEKKLESEDETKGPSAVDGDGNLVSRRFGKKSQELEVKKESVETGMVGSLDMFVLDSNGIKKRKKSEKEGTRKKRIKFLPEELDGKEVNILPENSVERSARETEELYFKLEKANRDLWLQNNSVSSFRNVEEKRGNCDYPAADLDDTEGCDGENVAQSRLVTGETEIDKSGNDKLRLVGDALGHGGDAVHKDPSPELCAGTTEASDREDDVYQSQDEKAESPQQDKFQSTDVFDFFSSGELPTKVLTKSNEKKKVKRMDELSGKAVQRVLEDEMLHVADTNDVPGRKSRKDAKPVKWTVRVRGHSPTALATSLHGGTVPSEATETRSSPIISKSTLGSFGEDGAQIKREVADTKPKRATKTPTPKLPEGPAPCPMACGKVYNAKTSAFYAHKAKCTGAPL